MKIKVKSLVINGAAIISIYDYGYSKVIDKVFHGRKGGMICYLCNNYIITKLYINIIPLGLTGNIEMISTSL